MARPPESRVLRCGELGESALSAVLDRYAVDRMAVAPGAGIPGSYWGAPEAGLIGNRLYLRGDTPVHSALHELSHYVCMSEPRRLALDTDAGGDALEECAVCYLQLLLADRVEGFGLERCLDDMDAWGYSFREGSARSWFGGDGRDARDWLLGHGLIDAGAQPTGRLRR